MDSQRIIDFAKTPRNIPKEKAKFFLRSSGKLGNRIIISIVLSILLSIITLIIYIFSIVTIWVPVFFIVVSIIIYFPMKFFKPKVEKLNNYPLSIGYVLMTENHLFNKNLQRGNSIIIFTKDDTFKLNSDWITNIGQQIKNQEIPNLDFLYQQMQALSRGKSIFSFHNIPDKLTKGIKIYYSYVFLDSKFLPGGIVPENRLLPLLIDDNNKAIAIPAEFLEHF